MNTKISSSLKYLWLLLILPLAFLFTGCGQLDEQASINKSGNYQTAESSALTESLGTQTDIDKTNGYRITAKLKSSDADVGINAIVKADEIAAKVSGTVDGQNKSGYMYFTDGKLYTEADGQKVCITYATGFDIDKLIALITKISTASVSININDYVVSLDGVNNILEKAGNNFRITMQAGQVLYLNFDSNNKLVAMQSSFDSESLKTEITVSTFSGDIDFPSFSDYKTLGL